MGPASSTLPRVPLSPTCPGAIPQAGPPLTGPSVICGPLAREQKQDANSMQGSPDGVVFTHGKDPRTLHGYCCGTYTECVVWQAEKKRLDDAKNKLASGQEIED